MTDFEAVYARHFDGVYRYVYSLCRDEHTAEEITQEAFYRAMTHMDRFDGKCRLYVWLCQIAKNVYFTYAKRQKDIDQMLERGELLTMEEFFEVWTEWKNTKYHTRKHRGLSDAGEKWVTPIEMFENGPRYEKAAPPREYAAMLLMKAATARVTNQGINKFGTLYTDTELAYYVNQKVNIKWDIDDVTKLYVYDMDGKKICEAVSAELLAFGPHCSQAALEKHLRDQKRNEREVREYLEERVRPYELRLDDGARPSDAVGMIDLTIKATPSQKLVSLPKDRMFRSGQASKTSRKKATDDTFLNAKGDKALSLLRAMNE